MKYSWNESRKSIYLNLTATILKRMNYSIWYPYSNPIISMVKWLFTMNWSIYFNSVSKYFLIKETNWSTLKLSAISFKSYIFSNSYLACTSLSSGTILSYFHRECIYWSMDWIHSHSSISTEHSCSHRSLSCICWNWWKTVSSCLCSYILGRIWYTSCGECNLKWFDYSFNWSIDSLCYENYWLI